MKAQIELNLADLRLINWCLAVAANTTAIQKGSTIPREEVHIILNKIRDMEERLIEAIGDKLSQDEAKVDPAVQLKLF